MASHIAPEFKMSDQVIMEWMGCQESGVARGLLAPEGSQDMD